MDNILQTLVARCATKSAELHAAAEAHNNGHWHVPENIGLRAEARALDAFGSLLTKLVGVKDAEPAPVAAVEPVKLAFTLLPGGVPMRLGGQTAPPIDIVGNGEGTPPAPAVGAPTPPLAAA